MTQATPIAEAVETTPVRTEDPADVAAAQPRNIKRAFAVNAVRLALAAAILILWEIAARQGWINPAFYSKPSSVWQALVDYYQAGTLVNQTLATFKAAAIALVIGVPAGIILGFLLAEIKPLDEIVSPFLVPLNSLPRIALVPVFIIWFGLTITTKVALAVTIIVFIMLFTARAAIKGVDPDLLSTARLLGFRRRAVFTKVVLPAAVPSLFAGIRLAVTYAILGVIASEMVAARDGLGLDIVRFANQLNISGVFALLLVLGLVATVISQGLERSERRLLKWQ
jgi:NitT/TauT family transport system permease protein